MEWNLRPSSMWEWENLFEFEPKANENPNPKKLLLQQQQDRADFSVEEAERGGISSGGSLHSPGETGGSGSDLGHASSKSSVSASINSSSFGESRATSNNNKFTLDGFEPATKAKQQPEISAGSGEPFLSLKLGKRMYYKEDIYSESSAVAAKKPSSSSATAAAAKRTKSASQSAQSPRCQVEGCNLDLSSAKDYHRKHRICESHSKSPRVIVGGIERRFCQQCSRFHGLSEFDENKRSCRRRLSDHNARRRKPQPEAVRLNPARFSSIYDEPQKMSLVFEQAPQRLAWPNFSWNHGAADGSNKSGHTKEYLSRPVKNAQGQILLASNEIPGSNIAMLYHNNPTRLTPNKSTAAPKFLHSGIEESVVSSELNTTQDLHRALSLLSTSSWGTRETTKPAVSHNATASALNNNNNNVVLNQGLVMPIGSSSLAEFWQTQHAAPIETEPRTNANANANANGHFQDLHLFKPPPTDSGLYPYHF